jgi:hypothetical protein
MAKTIHPDAVAGRGYGPMLTGSPPPGAGMGQQHYTVTTFDATDTWLGDLDDKVTRTNYLQLLRELDNLQADYTINNDNIPVSGTRYESVDTKWHGHASQARYNLQILLQISFHPKVDVTTILTKNHITDLAQMFAPRAPNMSYIVTHTPNHKTFNIPSAFRDDEQKEFAGIDGIVVRVQGMWLPSTANLKKAKQFFTKLIDAGILVQRDPKERNYVSISDSFVSQLKAFQTEMATYDNAKLTACTEDDRNHTFDVMAQYTANVVEKIPILRSIAERTADYNPNLYLQCHPHVVRAFDPVHLIASIHAQKHDSMKMFEEMPQDNWSLVLASCKVAAAHTHLFNCVLDKKIPPKKTTTS